MASGLSGMMKGLEEAIIQYTATKVTSLIMKGISEEKAKADLLTNARVAASQGDANEQNFLGCLYYFGSQILGIDKNQNEGLYWWTKSASQGNEHAKEVLQEVRGY